MRGEGQTGCACGFGMLQHTNVRLPLSSVGFRLRAEGSSAMLGCCASEHHLPPLLGRFSATESICILGCCNIRRYTSSSSWTGFPVCGFICIFGCCNIRTYSAAVDFICILGCLNIRRYTYPPPRSVFIV